jgi:hypothetical protein
MLYQEKSGNSALKGKILNWHCKEYFNYSSEIDKVFNNAYIVSSILHRYEIVKVSVLVLNHIAEAD